MAIPRPLAALAALSLLVVAFPGRALAGKPKPLQVQVTSLAFHSDTCCLTYRISAASAARLLIDTRDGCDAPGRQWRVSVTSPGRKGAKSNVGSGTCSAWTGLTKMRVRAGSLYKLTLCYDGGASASFPAGVDLRVQHSGNLTVDGPAGCESLMWGTTTTTATTTTTTTTEPPPFCTTTSTLQPCGGSLGSARIYAINQGSQNLLNSVPHNGTLELTIKGTDCHGGNPGCPNGQYQYDYEFWVNDPGNPGGSPRPPGKQIMINASHPSPIGSPTVADPNNTYVVQIPVQAGDPVTALDQDDFSSDNSGYLDVDMNLICGP